MSDSDLERLNKLVGQIVGKRFIQAMVAVSFLAFGLGAWLTRVESLLTRLSDGQENSALVALTRLAEFNEWREKKNEVDATQDNRLARVETKVER